MGDVEAKKAKEINPDDVIACPGCGTVLWTPGLKVTETLFGPDAIYCPHCETLLNERDAEASS